MFTETAIIKKHGKYYVHDNPDSGKWEFPSVNSGSKDGGRRLLKLMEKILSVKVVPLSLSEVFSEKTGAPYGSGADGVTATVHMVDDFVKAGAEGPVENTRWQWVSGNDLLRLGNLDNTVRRYLEKSKAGFVMKFASGPREPHRSVSAVIKGKDGKILMMEHPYQKIWSIPKGHIDPGETAREAVIRELAEELGIEVKYGDAELMTWYVEKYRNGDTTVPVKHYIYRIKDYGGTIRNNEKDKHGPIGMKWVAPRELKKMKDVSLMSLRAAESLGRKTAGIGGVLPMLALAMTIGNASPYIFSKPGRAAAGRQLMQLPANMRTLKEKGISGGKAMVGKGRSAGRELLDTGENILEGYRDFNLSDWWNKSPGA